MYAPHVPLRVGAPLPAAQGLRRFSHTTPAPLTHRGTHLPSPTTAPHHTRNPPHPPVCHHTHTHVARPAHTVAMASKNDVDVVLWWMRNPRLSPAVVPLPALVLAQPVTDDRRCTDGRRCGWVTDGRSTGDPTAPPTLGHR